MFFVGRGELEVSLSLHIYMHTYIHTIIPATSSFLYLRIFAQAGDLLGVFMRWASACGVGWSKKMEWVGVGRNGAVRVAGAWGWGLRGFVVHRCAC